MNATTPKVSVCIPAYNHEKYVAECIQSVLAQSFQDLEIVVTDDASTDRTVDVIEGFGDERIRLFRHSTNLGPSATANNNMNHAHGEYIAFLPSDEVFLPGKLQMQVDLLNRNPNVGAVFGHVIVVDELGRRISEEGGFYAGVAAQPNRTRSEWLRYFFFHGNCLFGSTAMIRRSLVNEIGYHDPRLLQLQDFDYWIRVCIQCEIYVIQAPLTKFRVRAEGANTSAGDIDTQVRVFWELLKVLQRYREITDLDLFAEVFPEAGVGPHGNSGSLRLALGRLAVGASQPALQLFGLDLLYEALGETSLGDSLETGFTSRDFFVLTGALDPYNIRQLAKISGELERLRGQVDALHAALTAARANESVP